MRMGVHRDTLAQSLALADEVWFFSPPDLGWDLARTIGPLGTRAHVSQEVGDLVAQLARTVRAGDHVLVMSNGGFGGLHGRLLAVLATRESAGATASANRD